MKLPTKIFGAFGIVAAIGVAALPLTSYAGTGNGSATITATINDTIAVAVSANIDFGTVTPGQSSTKTHSVTVTTNNLGGFTLKAYGTALQSGVHTISKNSSATAGVEGWALKGGDLTSFTAIGDDASTATTILDIGQQTAIYNDSTVITYTLGTTSNTATGLYNGTVTYVATTK